MQPKVPLRIARPHVWSHNTNYVGAVGKHSENSPGARARRITFGNRLSKVVSVLKEMERKNVQHIEKSKKDIQNSMLAYTERVKQINANRFLTLSPDGLESNSRHSTSDSKLNGLRNSFSPSDHSSQTSSDNERTELRNRNISPVKNRRVSLPKVRGPSNKKHVHPRRHSSDASRTIELSSRSKHIPSLLRDHPSSSPNSSLSDGEDVQKSTVNNKTEEEDSGSAQLIISPFPYESYNMKDYYYENVINKEKAHSPTQTRKRVSYKQFSVEKQRERMKQKAKEHDPFDHKKDILREQAQTRRAAILLERARQEALKSKKDVCRTFCYSFAMEELMKKSDPLAFVASEKDFVSKVEVDKDGTIKQTLGPAVLSIIGVDELNNYQGMRVKWSAKYRQSSSEETEQTEESFLPPITVGGHSHNLSRELTREHEQLQIEQICHDAQSTISAKKRGKRRRKSKATG